MQSKSLDSYVFNLDSFLELDISSWGDECISSCKWDLSSLFASWTEWDEAFVKLPSADEEKQFYAQRCDWVKKKKLDKETRASRLVVLLDELELKSQFRKSLLAYVFLKLQEDLADLEAKTREAKISLYSQSVDPIFASHDAFVVGLPMIASIVSAGLLGPGWTKSVSELLRDIERALPVAVEEAFTAVADDCSSEVHSSWLDLDMVYGKMRDDSGALVQLTNANIDNMLRNDCSVLRKKAYGLVSRQLKAAKNAQTVNFAGFYKRRASLSKLRRYDSTAESCLHGMNVPEAVVRNLVSGVRSRLASLHQWNRIKAQNLGLKRLEGCDTLASWKSVGKISPPKFSYDEAVDLICDAFAPLGAEYVSQARRGLTAEGWVHWGNSEGKCTGAFSYVCYGSKPYLMLVWNDTIDDVFTLAHEIGHSMHSFYTNANQPSQLSDYDISVAEVASILCEALLSKHLMTARPELRELVMATKLNNFVGTLSRQVMLTEFELHLLSLADCGEAFDTESLSGKFLELQREYSGSAIRFQPEAGLRWLLVPHFFYGLYMFQYATSFAAAEKIMGILRDHGEENFRNTTMLILRAGGSKTGVEILAAAGIDLTSPGLVDDAFGEFDAGVECLAGRVSILGVK